MTTITPITLKITSLYVAYALEFEVAAYGSCRDEALNNLSDKLLRQQGAGKSTGDEKNS